MFRTNISLLFACLFVPGMMISQIVDGIVVDRKTGSPISEVNIKLRKSKKGTFTGTNGTFSFALKKNTSGKDTITFSHIAYRSAHFQVQTLLKTDTIFLELQSNVIAGANVRLKKRPRPSVPFKVIKSLKKEIHSFEAFNKDSVILVLGGDMSYDQNGFLKTVAEDPTAGDFDFTGDPEGFNRFLIRSRTNTWNQISYNKKVYSYDPMKDSWKELDIKMRPKAFFKTHYDPQNEYVYVVGGNTISANGRILRLNHKLERIRLKDGLIEDLGISPHIAVDPELISVDGGFILAGGSISVDGNKKKEYIDHMHLYTIETGKWYRIGTLTRPKETSAILYQDKLYFFGGQKNKPLSEIESFDLTTGEWQKEGELFEALDELSIVRIDTTVYLYHYGKILTYDLVTKTLKEYPIKIVSRKPKLVEIEGLIYLLGGYKVEANSLKPVASSFVIDPKDLENTKHSQMAILK